MMRMGSFNPQVADFAANGIGRGAKWAHAKTRGVTNGKLRIGHCSQVLLEGLGCRWMITR
jgi:hypothetical protein